MLASISLSLLLISPVFFRVDGSGLVTPRAFTWCTFAAGSVGILVVLAFARLSDAHILNACRVASSTGAFIFAAAAMIVCFATSSTATPASRSISRTVVEKSRTA